MYVGDRDDRWKKFNANLRMWFQQKRKGIPPVLSRAEPTQA